MVRQLILEKPQYIAQMAGIEQIGYQRKLDREQEAHLIALACSKPPKGKKHWTMRLLTGQMVELKSVDLLSHETVRQVLKKTNPSRT